MTDMMLTECAPGDIVVVPWFDGSEQLVLFCTAMGMRKSKKFVDAYAAIVNLVDQETFKPYPPGAVELGDRHYNMFVMKDVEVIDVVQRSRHGKTNRDAERAIKRAGDEDDPLLRRMSALRDTDALLGGPSNGEVGNDSRRDSGQRRE